MVIGRKWRTAKIEPLGKKHDRAAFSCGKQKLDRYFREQASQDARRHIAAPIVAVHEESETTVLGYYTLSAFAVELGSLPEATVTRLRHYPLVPATLLGRLAVDQTHKGRGLGEFLLTDALRRAYEQSAQIASAAVVVEAMDDEAHRFYRYFDFIAFPERQDRLFLPMATIGKLFPKS